MGLAAVAVDLSDLVGRLVSRLARPGEVGIELLADLACGAAAGDEDDQPRQHDQAAMAPDIGGDAPGDRIIRSLRVPSGRRPSRPSREFLPDGWSGCP
jgi:hypothetical protein